MSGRFVKIFFLSFVLGTSLLQSIFSNSLEEFAVKQVLEDFEEQNWSNASLKVYSNASNKPEIKISKTITSPNIISDSSLFIRFPKETIDQNIEIRFISSKEIEKYLLAIRFQVFANSQGGELAFLIEDANFEIQRFSICTLNFTGWKEFQVNLGNKIYQQDRVFNKSSKVRFIGFIYTPALNKSINREDILVLDDIEIFVMDKYKVPQNFHRIGD